MSELNLHDGARAIGALMRNALRPVQRARRPAGTSADAAPPSEQASGAIPVDVVESDSEYVLYASLPGVAKDDVGVRVDGRKVCLSARCKGDASAGAAARVLAHERFVGRLARTLTMPDDIDEDNAKARLEDGVLQLRLPRKKTGRARNIALS